VIFEICYLVSESYTYVKLDGCKGGGQPLHVREMSGQLLPEQSFDNQKKDIIFTTLMFGELTSVLCSHCHFSPTLYD
jgi:hypothetical protein